MRAAAWEDLELVGHWRGYLAEPMRYLRHVIDDRVAGGPDRLDEPGDAG
jgi:hypothetical protein